MDVGPAGPGCRGRGEGRGFRPRYAGKRQPPPHPQSVRLGAELAEQATSIRGPRRPHSGVDAQAAGWSRCEGQAGELHRCNFGSPAPPLGQEHPQSDRLGLADNPESGSRFVM